MAEYEAAVKLAQVLATKLDLTISPAEVALLATFLVAQSPVTRHHPVVLYVMQGMGLPGPDANNEHAQRCQQYLCL